MRYFWYAKVALTALRANKMRSLLTTAGIVIGVATVISMVSIIDGMNKYVYTVLGSIGSSTVYLQKFDWSVAIGSGGSRRWREIQRRRSITVEDADALRSLDFVELAVPYRPLGQLAVQYRAKKLTSVSVVGGGERYLDIMGYEIERGRALTKDDNQYRRQVCIVGRTIAEGMFEDESPIDKEVEIGGKRFLVVGTLASKGKMLGEDLDNNVVVPLLTAEKHLMNLRSRRARTWYSLSVAVKVAEEMKVEDAIVRIEEVMRARRGLRFDEENDFGLNTQQMLVDAYNKFTFGIFAAMIGIASLSLVVGGIGIMNIMLVSVTERTREIGIRKTVGATKKDILLQFLLEAVFLTTAGGLIGVAIGLAIAKTVDLATPLPSSAPLWSILLGLGFASGVGLFFGIYPAAKASRLDPIKAISYE